MTNKPTNPKDTVGIAKAPMSTVPAGVMLEVGLAMMEGARKYGRHNYRVAGVRASVYYDATLRHLMSWWEGEDVDPDSGLSHITKAIAGLTVLRDGMIKGNWVDDRPPANKIDMARMNGWAQTLIEKYPDPVAAHTEQGVSWSRKDCAVVASHKDYRIYHNTKTGSCYLNKAGKWWTLSTFLEALKAAERIDDKGNYNP